MTEFKYPSDQSSYCFDPKTYLEEFYRGLEPQEEFEGIYEFFLKAQHNFWSKFGPPCSPNNADAVRCLEYGGGPVVAHLISAAAKVDRIVFAEFLEANRQAVSSWVEGNTESHNWNPFIEHVVCNLEGERSVEGVLNREMELKRKIKSVVSCDINKSPIVCLDDFDITKPFDVVSTNFCLESIASSNEEYGNAVAKLSQFLKPGGYLQIQGVLEGTWYIIGNEKYHAFPSTKTIVENAMKEAHLGDLEIKVVKQEKTGVISDHKFLYHAVGRNMRKQ